MERLIGFDFQLLFESAYMGINIFVLFFLLSYLLFNPVKNVLAKRRERVASELENAANKEKEANELKNEYENKLSAIEKEAEFILEEARKKARIRENDIIEEAKKQANIIIERANKEIELEKRKALDDVKVEVVSIANLIATRVLNKAIDFDMQTQLVEETLNEMGDGIWQN